jgi:hypothetical protein
VKVAQTRVTGVARRALFAAAGRRFEVFGERQAAETWARRQLDDAQG